MGVLSPCTRRATQPAPDRALDPEVDHDEILRLTAASLGLLQGTGIAFMRDYGIPSIAAVLDRTREFEDHGIKRYDDSILIGDEATSDGIDSPRRAPRSAAQPDPRPLRHARTTYASPPTRPSADGRLSAALATTSTRWSRGWCHPVRRADGHQGLPTTYDGYLTLLVDRCAAHFAHRTPPARQPIPETSTRSRSVSARRRAVMDEPHRAHRPAAEPRWSSVVEAGARARPCC